MHKNNTFLTQKTGHFFKMITIVCLHCEWHGRWGFLVGTVRGDETCLHHFECEFKKQSLEWHQTCSPTLKKTEKMWVQFMGKWKVWFLPSGTMVNSALWTHPENWELVFDEFVPHEKCVECYSSMTILDPVQVCTPPRPSWNLDGLWCPILPVVKILPCVVCNLVLWRKDCGDMFTRMVIHWRMLIEQWLTSKGREFHRAGMHVLVWCWKKIWER